jgi:hypothetical protein
LSHFNQQSTDAANADKKAAEEAARLEEAKKIMLKQDPSLPVANKVLLATSSIVLK